MFTVRAVRGGEPEGQSYIVGVYSSASAALEAARTEDADRGGKYECEVLEWSLDLGAAGREDVEPRIIKALGMEP